MKGPFRRRDGFAGRALGTLAAGLLFGAGLVISGMTDARNVLGFLDVFGPWRPELMGVMGGAVVVHALLLATIRWARRGHLAPAGLEHDRQIDAPLVLGAAIFGIGWGLSGYCPGPSITALGFGAPAPVVFVATMIVGLLAGSRVRARRAGCETV
jgi:uncharacterized membrane protein YedE/YeeE